VVIHDKNTYRVGNRNLRVKDQTLERLKELDVGFWKSEIYAGEKIPTLKEVLSTVPKDKKLIIEIKSAVKILPFLINDIISAGLKNEQVEFISFKYDVISSLKKEFPKSRSLLLADLDYTWMTKVFSPSLETLIRKAKSTNLDGINVWAGNLLTERFFYEVKWNGLLLYTWTVDDPSKAKQLVEWEIDAITTNKAQWLKNML
jgi:glycerophosphoryl diester phosphodiesterase